MRNMTLKLKTTLLLCLLLTGVGGLTMSCGVPEAPVASKQLHFDGTEPPFDERLTPAGQELFLKRMGEYLERKQKLALRKETLLRAGWPKESDTVEMGPSEFARPGVVMAQEAARDEELPDVDPLLISEVRAELTETLGREPTQDEIDRRIAADDAETAAVNDALERQKGELARYYKQGLFAQAYELEDRIIDSVIPDANRARSDEAISRYTDAEKRILNLRLHITTLNREAEEGEGVGL